MPDLSNAYALLAGFGISALLFIVALLLRRRLDWAAPLALGVGFAAGFTLLRGLPAVPPREAVERLTEAALAAGVVGLLQALLGRPAWLWAALQVPLLGAAAGFILLPKVRSLPTDEAALLLGALAGAGFAYWLLLAAWFHYDTAGWPALALAAVAGGTALLLAGSGNALLGVLAAVLAAALTPAALAGWLRGEPGLGRGAALAVCVPLLGLWLTAWHYSSEPISPLCLGLLAVVPLLALLVRGALGSLSGRWLAAPARLLALAPVAVVAALIVPGLASSESGGGSDEFTAPNLPNPVTPPAPRGDAPSLPPTPAPTDDSPPVPPP